MSLLATTSSFLSCVPAPSAPRIPRRLAIGGSDPTGGTGIQADLKSIPAHGGYGTAATAQRLRHGGRHRPDRAEHPRRRRRACPAGGFPLTAAGCHQRGHQHRRRQDRPDAGPRGARRRPHPAGEGPARRRGAGGAGAHPQRPHNRMFAVPGDGDHAGQNHGTRRPGGSGGRAPPGQAPAAGGPARLGGPRRRRRHRPRGANGGPWPWPSGGRPGTRSTPSTRRGCTPDPGSRAEPVR